MKKIGLFYGGSSKGSTRKVAEKIREAIGAELVDIHNIADADTKLVGKYGLLILGTSAWGIGDMHRDWEVFIDRFTDIDFTGKKIALFGLGDQKTYPESFADGMGTIFCRLPDKSIVVGYWPTEGYHYYFSLAENEGRFVGLVIDEDTQSELTDERISRWTSQVKKEFGLE